MPINLPCQMRFGLSIAVIFAALSAAANPLVQCPKIETKFSCEGGDPKLEINQSVQGNDVKYRIGGLDADGPMGEQMFELGADGKTLNIPLVNLPRDALRLAIVGSEAGNDEACCFRQMSLPTPSQQLCDVPVKSDDQSDENVEEQTLIKEKEPFDIALDLTFEPDCPFGAAGHLCTGTLGLSVTGDPIGAFPLSIEHSAFSGIDLQLSGPISCYPTGPNSQLCREEIAVLGSGLELPLTLTGAGSYQRRTVEICASLALPATSRQMVSLVQTALSQIGFDVGTADGQIGPKTRAGVSQLAQRFGLETDDPNDPAFLALLGLSPFVDGDANNNLVCASTVLPPRPRPKEPKRKVQKPEPENPRDDVVYDEDFDLICDPNSTVSRGSECACRFTKMIPISTTQCICLNGRLPGERGCGE